MYLVVPFPYPLLFYQWGYMYACIHQKDYKKRRKWMLKTYFAMTNPTFPPWIECSNMHYAFHIKLPQFLCCHPFDCHELIQTSFVVKFPSLQAFFHFVSSLLTASLRDDGSSQSSNNSILQNPGNSLKIRHSKICHCILWGRNIMYVSGMGLYRYRNSNRNQHIYRPLKSITSS